MNAWYGILIVLGGLSGLLGGIGYVKKRFKLSAELSRKLVHMGMGLICTLFPLVFTQVWPVLLLGASSISTLFLVRKVPGLKKTVGASLHEVKRFSLGEIYFPAAIVLVWVLCVETPLFYSLSILVLTLADAFAALVGTGYGRQRYTTKEGYKTWEGSFIFFIVTFLCIHIPLLLMTDIGRSESIATAVLIGILIMIIEAISWKGLDNLFIPLLVCTLLNIYHSYDAGQIWTRVVFMLCAILFLFMLRSRLKLDDASILGASLALYVSITIGGWQWGIAPLILFANYLFLDSSQKTDLDKIHNIYAVLTAVVPGLIWLGLYFKYEQKTFFFFYTIAYMAELICIYVAQWAFEFPEKKLLHICLKSSASGFIMMMIPYLLLSKTDSLYLFLSGAVCAALFSSQVFRYWQPDIRDCPLNKIRFFRQSAIGIIFSFALWILVAA